MVIQGMKSFTFVAMCSTAFGIMLASCSGSYGVRLPSPSDRIDNSFQAAYDAFDRGDLPLARNLLEKYVRADTGMWNFESFEFLAKTFDIMSERDSASWAYSEGIAMARSKLSRNPSDSSAMNIIDSLEEWKSQYPSLPGWLEKENGYVPYDQQPQILEHPVPIYPPGFSDTVEHICKVKAFLDDKGHVTRVEIFQSGGPECDQASIEAMYKWTFTPAKMKGRPVPVWVVLPFHFRPRQ